MSDQVTTDTYFVHDDIDLMSRAPAVEAILFAAGFPVKYEKIAETCEISEAELDRILSSSYFAYENRGIRLVRFSDSCQLCSNEFFEKQVKRALGMRVSGGLSNSSMETLAIIAYTQPVTRALIEQIRGVDCSYAVTTLIENSSSREKGVSTSRGSRISTARRTPSSAVSASGRSRSCRSARSLTPSTSASPGSSRRRTPPTGR